MVGGLVPVAMAAELIAKEVAVLASVSGAKGAGLADGRPETVVGHLIDQVDRKPVRDSRACG